jgi:hypothetical protein
MAEIKKYKNWLTESEKVEKYKPTPDELKSLTDSNPVSSALKKANLTKGFVEQGYTGGFSLSIDIASIREYGKILDDIDIEMVPDYFNSKIIDISYRNAGDRVQDGKYQIDHVDTGSQRRITRVIPVLYNVDSFDKLSKIVSDSIEEIIAELKKVRIIVQIDKKEIPADLKTPIKNKAKETYKKVVDQFFYEGKKPDLEDIDLGEMIAGVYASNKSVLDTISSIENEDVIDSIIKSLEKMKETDLIKVLKSYLKSTRIIKGI